MNESSLPFFTPGTDPGSSFADLLARTSPEAPMVAQRAISESMVPEITHGRPWSPSGTSGAWCWPVTDGRPRG
jgi:hypothetical protein